jgi:CMP/dCMP kinase
VPSKPPSRGLVVAIDGPAGAGKSTAARMLAARLGYDLLDTGAIYRVMALLARRRGIPWDDGPRVAELATDLQLAFRLDGDLNRVLLDGADVTAEIRTPEMSDGASRVSALPAVRAVLLGIQRRPTSSGRSERCGSATHATRPAASRRCGPPPTRSTSIRRVSTRRRSSAGWRLR